MLNHELFDTIHTTVRREGENGTYKKVAAVWGINDSERVIHGSYFHITLSSNNILRAKIFDTKLKKDKNGTPKEIAEALLKIYNKIC